MSSLEREWRKGPKWLFRKPFSSLHKSVGDRTRNSCLYHLSCVFVSMGLMSDRYPDIEDVLLIDFLIDCWGFGETLDEFLADVDARGVRLIFNEAINDLRKKSFADCFL